MRICKPVICPASHLTTSYQAWIDDPAFEFVGGGRDFVRWIGVAMGPGGLALCASVMLRSPEMALDLSAVIRRAITLPGALAKASRV